MPRFATLDRTVSALRRGVATLGGTATRAIVPLLAAAGAIIGGERSGAAAITVISADRATAVLVDIPTMPGAFVNDVQEFAGLGLWESSLLSSCSPFNVATSMQSTMVGATGISGSHTVTAQAAASDGVDVAVANALSRLDVVFAVDRFTIFTLTASYAYDNLAGGPPPISPFLSIAGNQLYLPEPSGLGDFGLTLALGPGVYSFSAIAVVGAIVTEGSGDMSTSSLTFSYAFAPIPAPGALLAFGVAGGLCARRRRR